MVRIGGDNFWRGMTCHMAILALPYGLFSSRMGRCRVLADADSATLEQLAHASDIAQKWLEGKATRRVIVVPRKLVNLVP